MASQGPARELGLKSVLVASDFTDASSKPLRHAISIARHFHAKFYLAHVVSSIGFTIAGRDTLEAAADAARRDVEGLEGKLVESGTLTGLSHEFIVREGNGVWEELRAILREKQVELVVIGTHGRHGIGKLVLGSVAEQIFREADGLVLTVGPHSLPEAPLDRLNGSSFLFPTDFGEASAHALPQAISFANHFGARLVFLHVEPVMPIPEGFSWSKTPDDITQIREDARQKALKRMHEFVAGSTPLSVTPEFLVEFGKHGESILHVARSVKADLIILGLDHSKHGGVTSHLPQTTAYKIATEAHCSVLTVRN